jgi:effector-binding domain-containing protein
LPCSLAKTDTGRRNVMSAGQEPENVVNEEREPQPVLSIRQTIELARLTEAQAASLRDLWSSMHRRGLRTAGPPFVRYHSFGESETDLEVGIPVVAASSGEGHIEVDSYRAEPRTTWHIGSHDGLGDAYARLEAWLKEHGRQADGAAWEVYSWIDPQPGTRPIHVAHALGMARATGAAV